MLFTTVIPILLIACSIFLYLYSGDLNAKAKNAFHFFAVLVLLLFCAVYSGFGVYHGAAVANGVTTCLGLSMLHWIMAMTWGYRKDGSIATKTTR